MSITTLGQFVQQIIDIGSEIANFHNLPTLLTFFQGVKTNKNVKIVALCLYKYTSITKIYHYTV